jgi:hypothetical protein
MASKSALTAKQVLDHRRYQDAPHRQDALNSLKKGPEAPRVFVRHAGLELLAFIGLGLHTHPAFKSVEPSFVPSHALGA